MGAKKTVLPIIINLLACATLVFAKPVRHCQGRNVQFPCGNLCTWIKFDKFPMKAYDCFGVTPVDADFATKNLGRNRQLDSWYSIKKLVNLGTFLQVSPLTTDETVEPVNEQAEIPKPEAVEWKDKYPVD